MWWEWGSPAARFHDPDGRRASRGAPGRRGPGPAPRGEQRAGAGRVAGLGGGAAGSAGGSGRGAGCPGGGGGRFGEVAARCRSRAHSPRAPWRLRARQKGSARRAPAQNHARVGPAERRRHRSLPVPPVGGSCERTVMPGGAERARGPGWGRGCAGAEPPQRGERHVGRACPAPRTARGGTPAPGASPGTE